MNRQYENLLEETLRSGSVKADRTGTGTRSVFGRQLRYDLTEGFPRITTKFVPMKPIKGELIWFLSGCTNVKPLQDQGITIWDEWADANGDLGPVYGAQWRSWPNHRDKAQTIDQISRAVHLLNTDPDSRRIIVSAWNPADIEHMALAPCHAFFQLYVAHGQLSCQVYQRSADLFLGVPFNITSYALLTHMFAQQANLKAKELIWTGGDCHIYANHVKQVEEQITHEPYPFPKLRLKRAPSIFDYTMDDIDASYNYQHHPALKGDVAV